MDNNITTHIKLLLILLLSNYLVAQTTLEKEALANKIRILPLGNSITFDSRSNDDRNIGEKFGYRAHLYSLLQSAGFNFDFIGSEHSGGSFLPAGFDEHAGFPGISDDELLYLMQTGHLLQLGQGIDRQVTAGAYLNSYNPDVILLHIGTNGNDEVDGTSPLEVNEILNVIDEYENNSGKEVLVLLARIVDRVPNQQYVEEFNNHIDSVAVDRAQNPLNPAYPDQVYVLDMQESAGLVYSIDINPNPSTGDMYDELHPNSRGYKKMAELWFEKLVELLPNPPIITKQPDDQYTIQGKSARFSVSVSSIESVLFQWQKNGVNIPLATDSVLNLSNISLQDNGAEYSCKISNQNGTVLTRNALLFVNHSGERITNSLLAEYDFEEEEGNTIFNKLGNSDLDLQIFSTSAVEWVEHGLKISSNSNISTNNSATLVNDSIHQSNQFSIELWLSTSELSQMGPARIFTISEDNSKRNLTLGQSSESLVFRTRTTETDLNGIPEFVSDNGLVENVLTHLIFTRNETGQQKIYLNGELFNTNEITGSLSNWNSNYKLAIGNEFESNQPWIGNIYHLAIYQRSLTDEEISHNFEFGEYGITDLDEENFIVDKFSLSQNYPNPFNPSTVISFTIEKTSKLDFTVFNVLGEKVFGQIEKHYLPGRHSIKFDATNLPSGVYMYSLKVTGNDGSNFADTKKMLLLK